MEDYMEAERALALDDRIVHIRNLSIANPLPKGDARNRAQTIHDLEKQFHSFFYGSANRDDWSIVSDFEAATTKYKKRKKPLDISHLKLIKGGTSGV